jgi:hypothetical protein
MKRHTVHAVAPGYDPERLIVAWRGGWPAWKWAEFRGQDAVKFRDSLSPAHASMLHGGDIIDIYDCGHGDFEAIESLLREE